MRRKTRKQLFRPGTHSILNIKPIENIEMLPEGSMNKPVKTIKESL
jgi:hypothetical protein